MAIKSALDLMIGGWKVKDEVFLADEDKAMFSSAKVVSSDFGKQVCFFLKKGGGQQYIPLSYMGEQLAVGDSVNLDAISIQIWGKEGEQDIMRAKINKL